MEPRVLQVESMLRSTYALLEPLAKRRRAQLAAPAGDANLRVVADQRALGHVLLNVIGNAIKFNRDGGEVPIGNWRLTTVATACSQARSAARPIWSCSTSTWAPNPGST